MALARGSHLRIHYKHCREIANAIKGLTISKAKSYLEKVLAYKEAIPVTVHTGGIGRHAQGKKYNAPGDKVSWPQKATKTFVDLLTNINSNAEVSVFAWEIVVTKCHSLLYLQAKGLDLEKVKLTHASCQRAPKMRRRTYRAHGRINGR